MKTTSMILASAFLLCVGAHANTFQFTLTSNGVTGSGTLTGVMDPYNSSAFDITTATGSFGGYTLSLVTPSGNINTVQQYSGSVGDPYPYDYDNVLFITGTAVDVDGLLFKLSGGPSVLNVYSVSGAYETSEGTTAVYNPVYAASFSFTAVPEPSSLLVLLAASAVLVVVKQRLRRA